MPSDKKRLDWLLFKNAFNSHMIESWILKPYYDGEYKTPRKALDAAMKAEAHNKKEK